MTRKRLFSSQSPLSCAVCLLRKVPSPSPLIFKTTSWRTVKEETCDYKAPRKVKYLNSALKRFEGIFTNNWRFCRRNPAEINIRRKGVGAARLLYSTDSPTSAFYRISLSFFREGEMTIHLFTLVGRKGGGERGEEKTRHILHASRPNDLRRRRRKQRRRGNFFLNAWETHLCLLFLLSFLYFSSSSSIHEMHLGFRGITTERDFNSRTTAFAATAAVVINLLPPSPF